MTLVVQLNNDKLDIKENHLSVFMKGGDLYCRTDNTKTSTTNRFCNSKAKYTPLVVQRVNKPVR